MAVTIRHGVNSTSSDSVAGKTVAEVREQLEDVLNIPASAQVRVNGNPAGEDNEIADGSTVEFVKVAGEKGCRA
jgi:molybdopterin converting factor small subunit